MLPWERQHLALTYPAGTRPSVPMSTPKHTYRLLKRGISSQSTGLAATMLGTRALRTDGLQRSRRVFREPCSSCAPYPGLVAEKVDQRAGRHVGQSPPDIEAMVGVWGVLSPLEQCPLKLDGDLGDRVGRQLNQHL